MEKIYKAMSLLACAALVTLDAVTAEAQIVNGGFESGPGLAGWSSFGNAFLQTNPNPTPTGAHGGTNTAKEFGTFPGVSGAFQQFATLPGQVWDLNGWILNASSDAMQQSTLGGTNFALLKISFHNAGGEILGIDSQHVTADTPQDVWQFVDATGTAPAGTTFVQLFALFVQPHTLGGSASYDDIVAVPEPSSIGLAVAGLLGFVTVLRKRRA